MFKVNSFEINLNNDYILTIIINKVQKLTIKLRKLESQILINQLKNATQGIYSIFEYENFCFTFIKDIFTYKLKNELYYIELIFENNANIRNILRLFIDEYEKNFEIESKKEEINLLKKAFNKLKIYKIKEEYLKNSENFENDFINLEKENDINIFNKINEELNKIYKEDYNKLKLDTILYVLKEYIFEHKNNIEALCIRTYINKYEITYENIVSNLGLKYTTILLNILKKYRNYNLNKYFKYLNMIIEEIENEIKKLVVENENESVITRKNKNSYEHKTKYYSCPNCYNCVTNKKPYVVICANDCNTFNCYNCRNEYYILNNNIYLGHNPICNKESYEELCSEYQAFKF